MIIAISSLVGLVGGTIILWLRPKEEDGGIVIILVLLGAFVGWLAS